MDYNLAILPKQATNILVKFFCDIFNHLPKEELINQRKIDLEEYIGLDEDDRIEVSVELDSPSFLCLLSTLHNGFQNIADENKKFQIETIKNYTHDEDDNIISSDRKEHEDALIGPDQTVVLETGNLFFVSDGVIKIALFIGSNLVVMSESSEWAETFIKSLKHALKHNNIYKDQILRMEGGFNLKFFPKSGITNTSWEDVVIDDHVMEILKLNCISPIIDGDKFTALKIPRSRGTILSGPPGTGKTRTLTALANQLDGRCTIIIAYGSDINNSQAINNIYNTATALAPTLLIMEDIDLAIPDRMTGHTDPLSEILQCLQGLEDKNCVISIATTNRLEALDVALKDRPGRFDKIVEFKTPDMNQCAKLIELFIKDKQGTCEFDVNRLAKRCSEAKLTGAKIREIIDFAAISLISAGKEVSLTEENINESFNYFENYGESMGFRRK